jgi:hypothetical protein
MHMDEFINELDIDNHSGQDRKDQKGPTTTTRGSQRKSFNKSTRQGAPTPVAFGSTFRAAKPPSAK